MRLLAVAAAAAAACLAQAQLSGFRADSLIAYTIANVSRVTERITLEEWSEMPIPGTIPKLSTTVLSSDPANPGGNMTWITADGVSVIGYAYQQSLLSLAADGSRLTIAGYPVAEGVPSPAFTQLSTPPVRRVVQILPDRTSSVLGHVPCGFNAALSTYSVDRTGVWVACRGINGLTYIPAGGVPASVHANFSTVSQLAFVPAPSMSSSAPAYGDMFMVGASADGSASGGSSSSGSNSAREVGVFRLGFAGSAPMGVQGAQNMPSPRTFINNTAAGWAAQPGYNVPSTPTSFVAHLGMLPTSAGIPAIFTRFWVCDNKAASSGGGIYVYEPVDPIMAPNGQYRMARRITFPARTTYGCAAISGRYVGNDLILHVLLAQTSLNEQSVILAFNTSSGLVRTALRSAPNTLIRSFAYAPCDPTTNMCPIRAPDGLLALPPLTPAAADALLTADWTPAMIEDPLVPTPSPTSAPIRASVSASPSASQSVTPTPSPSQSSKGNGNFLASPTQSGKPAQNNSNWAPSPSASGKPAVESPSASALPARSSEPTASVSGKPPLQESVSQTPKAPVESPSATGQAVRASQSPSGVPARSSEPSPSGQAQTDAASATQTPKGQSDIASPTMTQRVSQESASQTPKVQQESATQTPKVQQESATQTPKVQQESPTMTQRVSQESASQTPKVQQESATQTPKVQQESASQTPKVMPSASNTPKGISASASATRSPFSPRPTPSGTPSSSMKVATPSALPSKYPSRSPLAVDSTISTVKTAINFAYATPSAKPTPAASRAPGASPQPAPSRAPASAGAAMANAAAMCAIREKLAAIAGLPASNVSISALVEWRWDMASNTSAAYLLRFLPAADNAGCRPSASPSPAVRIPGLRALQAADASSTLVTEEPITREAAASYGAVPPSDPQAPDSEGSGLSIPFEMALDAPPGSDAAASGSNMASQLNAAQSRVQSAFASLGSGNEADAILSAVASAAGAPVAAGAVPSGQVAQAQAQAPPASPPSDSSSGGSAAGAVIGSLIALAVVAGAIVVVRRARRNGSFTAISSKAKARMSKSPVVTMTVQTAHPGSAAGAGAGTGMRAASARSAAAVATSADVISFANPVANVNANAAVPMATPVPQAAQVTSAPSSATAPRTASLPHTGEASPESAAKNASLGAYKGQQTAFAPQVARNARRSTAAGMSTASV